MCTDPQAFEGLLMNEAEIAAKESWLQHDLQLLRHMAKLLPAGDTSTLQILLCLLSGSDTATCNVMVTISPLDSQGQKSQRCTS